MVVDSLGKAERCPVGAVWHRLPALAHGLRCSLPGRRPMDCGAGFAAIASGRQRRGVLRSGPDLSLRGLYLDSFRPLHERGRAPGRSLVSQATSASPDASRAEKERPEFDGSLASCFGRRLTA